MPEKEQRTIGTEKQWLPYRPCHMTRAPNFTTPIAQGTHFWEYSYQTRSLAGQTSRRIYLVHDCCKIGVLCTSERLAAPGLCSNSFRHFSISPFPISYFQFPIPGFSSTPQSLPSHERLNITPLNRKFC